jgi:uncharacterized protein (TIGR03437 family)
MNAATPRSLVVATVALAALALWFHRGLERVFAATPRFSGPINSQPLALSADNSLLAVANPDNNSISLFDTVHNAKLAEILVGKEPNSVALSPDGSTAYVANTVSGTVSVLRINSANTYYATLLATIPVGTEPYALALTPGGSKLYVANARSNSVSVIDTSVNQVIKTISNVGFEPRGIAITNGGGADTQETVYVTQFLSLPVAGKFDGADDAKAGHVTVISAATDTATADIVLNPIPDTGFKAAGDALKHIAPPASPQPADFKFTTGAYPNQLNQIAIRGRFAFVPNTGASPNGPVRFNVNTHSLLSVIDLTAKQDAIQTINMHLAVQNQTNPAKRFITQPWAMAFKHQADEGYVVSAASNIVVKVKIDPSTGAPTVQTDPTDTTRVLEIPTGKNPRGIVVNSSDTTAYVMNYVSRDVTVINLTGTVEAVTATMQSSTLPTSGTPDDRVQVGKELYFTSVGVFDPATPGGAPITGRMSNNGWGACSACHPFGVSDNVVWIFATGPRRTVPQHADFAPGDPTTQKALNWSAIFDEEEDFEANIRGVSGGLGLIVLADGVTQDPNVAAFTPASGGRTQLKVRGVGAWDALKAFISIGIRAPISPASKTDPDVVAGRALFTQANCQNCHGTSQWTTSRVRATPPPDASLISGAQLIAELKDVGTFDATAPNEVRATGAPPLGPNGFNPPPLLSLFAFPQTFFHNGSAASLDAVLQSVTHRSAGTNGVDMLQSATARQQLISFLESIDASTQPIPPNPPTKLSSISAASYIGTTVAPESDVAGFGVGLAPQTQVATAVPLPAVLAGSSLSVQDAAHVLRLAPLFFVSAQQINYEVPPGTAPGNATVTVATASGATASGTVQIASVAPGLFSANGNGTGVAAATAVRVNADGSQSPVTVFQSGSSANSFVPVPIDLSSGPVFLTLYGTGIRNRSSLTGVVCTIGGANATVQFAGAQGAFVGLDQVNVQVPPSLAGAGQVTISLTVDGQAANPVIISVQ